MTDKLTPANIATLNSIFNHVPMRRRPQQQRSYERIWKILNTAADIITEEGVGALTIIKIGKKSKLPVGSIYQFFDDINSIQRALIERATLHVDASIISSIGPKLSLDNWEKSIERAIDITLKEFNKDPAVVPLVQNVYRTSIYQEVNQRSNEQLVQSLLSAFNATELKLPKTQLEVMCRSIVEIGSTFQVLVWNAKSKRQALAYTKEWKIIVKNYMREYLG